MSEANISWRNSKARVAMHEEMLHNQVESLEPLGSYTCYFLDTSYHLIKEQRQYKTRFFGFEHSILNQKETLDVFLFFWTWKKKDWIRTNIRRECRVEYSRIVSQNIWQQSSWSENEITRKSAKICVLLIVVLNATKHSCQRQSATLPRKIESNLTSHMSGAVNTVNVPCRRGARGFLWSQYIKFLRAIRHPFAEAHIPSHGKEAIARTRHDTAHCFALSLRVHREWCREQSRRCSLRIE